MAIRCGACGNRHQTVAEVRRCFPPAAPKHLTPKWAKSNMRSFGANVDSQSTRMVATRMATRPQADYIVDLLNKISKVSGSKEGIANKAMFTDHYTANTTFAMASETIDELKIALKKAESAARAPTPSVPDGRYALRNAEGIVKFYKVNSPAEGRWAGRTFVDAMASDERWPIRNPGERARILAEIAADVQGALQLYGQEIGSCGHCGRTLTDETSRARGIGPVCWEKLGF